jgi:hypothetical protein
MSIGVDTSLFFVSSFELAISLLGRCVSRSSLLGSRKPSIGKRRFAQSCCVKVWYEKVESKDMMWDRVTCDCDALLSRLFKGSRVP